MPKNNRERASAPRATIELAPEEDQAVKRFIEITDWNGFWSRVTECAAVEVDAYEKARVKSLQTAPQHVFM
jgi:hypothetical protein